MRSCALLLGLEDNSLVTEAMPTMLAHVSTLANRRSHRSYSGGDFHGLAGALPCATSKAITQQVHLLIAHFSLAWKPRPQVTFQVADQCL